MWFQVGIGEKPEAPNVINFKVNGSNLRVNNSGHSDTGSDGKVIAKGLGLDLEKRPIHKGSAEQQEKIDYAWDISHDPKFIYLLKAENGTLDPTRKSKLIGSNGYRDYGICQINKGFHPEIVNDPRFSDWKWQLDQCLRMYKGGVTFYGLKHINAAKKHFTWT